ncbi:MAG TPA: hypothetical protein VEI83_08845 [Acidimicrobiales bacterium]|nr:hypothetical protein [Acidimicrobiales bacterium]
MTRPFEAHLTETPSFLLVSSEHEVTGLLRRVARELALLRQAPAYPGRGPHLEAASRAVWQAIEELQRTDR